MKKTPLFLSLALLVQSAGATEWHNLGPRSLAMGGTGVALAQGAVGAYWNPAGLAQAENTHGLQVPVGIGVNITGPFLEGANDLNELAKNCGVATPPGTGACPADANARIQNAVNKINSPESGVRADVGAGANLKIGKLAVFANNYAFVGGRPQADFTNLTGTTVDANASRVDLRGIVVTELGVGYGMGLPFFPGMMVGGNVKALVGRVGFQRILLSQEESDADKFDENRKTSVQPGFDLGALWDMNKTFSFLPMRPRVGITARNINNPKFDQPDQAKAAGEPDKFSYQGQTRVGAAISPLRFWNITADADLTRNLTPQAGVASRMVGVGTEVNVLNRTWLNIPVRAGLMRNTALEGAKTMVTGGFGLNFLHLTLDAAVAVSPSTQKIQSEGKSEEIPSSVSGSLQIGLQFGGGKDKKKDG